MKTKPTIRVKELLHELTRYNLTLRVYVETAPGEEVPISQIRLASDADGKYARVVIETAECRREAEC